MAGAFVTLALAASLAATGGHYPGSGGRVMPRGPGYGWGFPNGNPDGYGWVNYDTFVPLWADRTPEYFFPRHFAVSPVQLFLPSYYNPYVNRGQRYLPYSGCGGCHPAGRPAAAGSVTPVHPYAEAIRQPPTVAVPAYSGRVEGGPVDSGGMP
jgi:hypothetical protein